MSTDETLTYHFIFNTEHDQLLTQLQTKTARNKHQLIRDAIRLALSSGLLPATFQWNKRENKSFHVRVPAGDYKAAKKLWKGRLTPLAVSGILEMTKAEIVGKVEIADIHALKEELAKTTQRIDSLIRSLSTEQPPLEFTDMA